MCEKKINMLTYVGNVHKSLLQLVQTTT